MSASIYGTRLAYADRELPWHSIGVAFNSENPPSLKEALSIARCDYRVGFAKPYGLMLDNETVLTPDMVHGDSVSNGNVVVRYPNNGDETYTILGSASEQFNIMQNGELAELVEPLTKWGKLDTMGSLGDGERFFICLRGEQWNFMVNGREDEQEMYLIAKNTHLPGQALQIQLVNVRLVCQNTWMAGDALAFIDLPLAHKGNLKQTAQWVVDVLDKLPAKKEQIKEAAAKLAQKPITAEQVKEGIDTILPLPQESKLHSGLKSLVLPVVDEQIAELDARIDKANYQLGVQTQRILDLRQAVYNTYRESETVDRGTAWGFVNAVTEAFDYTTKVANSRRQTMKAARANVFGERAGYKLAAFKFAMKF